MIQDLVGAKTYQPVGINQETSEDSEEDLISAFKWNIDWNKSIYFNCLIDGIAIVYFLNWIKDKLNVRVFITLCSGA